MDSVTRKQGRPWCRLNHRVRIKFVKSDVISSNETALENQESTRVQTVT